MLPSPRPTATAIAIAIAMIAHTEDSSPIEKPESTVVAGPVRADSAISRTGTPLGGGELLGDLAGHEREDHSGQHGVEDLQVVHVVLGHEEGTDDGDRRRRSRTRG